MSEIRIGSESELIKELLGSKVYNDFHNEQLPHKVSREKRAWKLLEEHKGQYTKEVLNHAFDTVDFYETNKRWFGSLLAMPNRNLIFESSPELINRWMTELLFSGQEPETSHRGYQNKIPGRSSFEDSSKGYVRRYVEFEFKSSGFKSHIKSKRRCHYVICWEHDWKDCPVPVRELKQELRAILDKR